MPQIAISVVVPVRNRTGLRLENCLRSLRWQEGVDAAAVEIALSDFGSDAEHAARIDELAARHGARVVRVRTDETWNRSRALNVALRRASGPVALCTDADILFEKNFLRTALGRLGGAPGSSMVLCRCLDLPDMGPERLFEPEEFESLKARSQMRKAMGTGACQATSTAWLASVGGYDEKYVHWGFEDKDLAYRASKAGLALEWIHGETSMLHQWHPKTLRENMTRVYLNKIRFYLTRGTIKKNAAGWGLPGGASLDTT